MKKKTKEIIGLIFSVAQFVFGSFLIIAGYFSYRHNPNIWQPIVLIFGGVILISRIRIEIEDIIKIFKN